MVARSAILGHCQPYHHKFQSVAAISQHKFHDNPVHYSNTNSWNSRRCHPWVVSGGTMVFVPSHFDPRVWAVELGSWSSGREGCPVIRGLLVQFHFSPPNSSIIEQDTKPPKSSVISVQMYGMNVTSIIGWSVDWEKQYRNASQFTNRSNVWVTQLYKVYTAPLHAISLRTERFFKGRVIFSTVLKRRSLY